MYKKIIAGIMSMCMLCSVSVVNAEENNVLYGDANVNGTVDVCDVTAVKKHIVKLDELSGQGFINADVDRNGSVGVDDLGSLVKYKLKIIDSFEEESAPAVTTVPEETTSYDECTTTTMPSLSDYVPMEEIKMSISNGETTVIPEKMMVHATVFTSGGLAAADGYAAFFDDYADHLENPPVLKFSTDLKIDTNADTVQESMKIFKYGDKCEYIKRINSLEEMLDFESGQYLIQFNANKRGEPIPPMFNERESEYAYFFIVVDLEKEESAPAVTTVPEETTSVEYTTTTMPSLSDYVPMESIKMSVSNGETTVTPEKMMICGYYFDYSSYNTYRMVNFICADGKPMFHSNYVQFVENPPVVKFSPELKIDTNASEVNKNIKIYKNDTKEYIKDINSFEELSDFENGQYLVEFKASKMGEENPAFNGEVESEYAYFFIVVDLEK